MEKMKRNKGTFFKKNLSPGFFILILISCSASTVEKELFEDSAKVIEKASVVEQPSDLDLVYRYISQRQDQFEIFDPKTELRLISEKNDEYGIKHIKFIQIVGAVPVWRNYLIAHIKNGQVFRVDGAGIAIPGTFSVTPGISVEQAEKNAKNILSQVSNTELSVLVLEKNTIVLAYVIEVSQGMNRKIVFVNANSGAVEKVLDGVHS